MPRPSGRAAQLCRKALASALVRVKGDQVTDADLVRATEKFGEYQSALIEVAKAKVLDRVPAVDAKGDGEAFTLRVPESLGEAASEPEDAAAEASAAGEKPTEPSAEAAADPAEKKPVRRRRTRRKKAAEPEGEGRGCQGDRCRGRGRSGGGARAAG